MRTPTEVKVDLQELQDSGKRNPGKMGALRKELVAALEAENIALKQRFDGGITQPIDFNKAVEEAADGDTIFLAPDVDYTLKQPIDFAMQGIPDPFQSDEWKFIEKSCSELVPPKSATQLKAIYNDIDAKVKTWRIARRVVRKMGIGVDWPQFPALGLNPSKGQPLHDHSILSDDWIPGYEPQPEPKPTAKQVVHTEEGEAPPESDIFSSVLGMDPIKDVKGEIENRPEPVREHPATAGVEN